MRKWSKQKISVLARFLLKENIKHARIRKKARQTREVPRFVPGTDESDYSILSILKIEGEGGGLILNTSSSMQIKQFHYCCRRNRQYWDGYKLCHT